MSAPSIIAHLPMAAFGARVYRLNADRPSMAAAMREPTLRGTP